MNSVTTARAGTSSNKLPNSSLTMSSTTALSDMKLGGKISIADRLRWIKMPENSQHSNEVQWWPGVIYDNFMELIQDVDNVQFKGKCLLKKMKLAKENKNPTVALTFYGDTFRLRTIFHDHDLKERVAVFYDNMDAFYTNRDRTLPDDALLVSAVNRVLSLIEELIRSPNGSNGGSPKRKVSPCTADNCKNSLDTGIETTKEHSPGVRAIENDFGTSSVDSVAEQETDDWQQVIVQQSQEDVTQDEKSIASTPSDNHDYTFSRKESENTNRSERTHESQSDDSLNIDPHVEWRKVFGLLTSNGWKWFNGGVLYDKVLIKPGHKFKGGKVGIDFFPTDIWGHGDEIKEYIHQNYGWVGPRVHTDSGNEWISDEHSEGTVSFDNSERTGSIGEPEDHLVDDNVDGEDEDDFMDAVVETKSNHGCIAWSQVGNKCNRMGGHLGSTKKSKHFT